MASSRHGRQGRLRRMDAGGVALLFLRETSMLQRRKVYTTGQVSEIANVASRTVSLWFDSGLLKGYRIPGSQDRRIPHDNLIKFLTEHGMPIPEELKDESEEPGTAGSDES
jgi:hypothetical protein